MYIILKFETKINFSFTVLYICNVIKVYLLLDIALYHRITSPHDVTGVT